MTSPGWHGSDIGCTVQLIADWREAQLQKKIKRVQEQCKAKLQEVHNGYLQGEHPLPSLLPLARAKQHTLCSGILGALSHADVMCIQMCLTW